VCSLPSYFSLWLFAIIKLVEFNPFTFFHFILNILSIFSILFRHSGKQPLHQSLFMLLQLLNFLLLSSDELIHSRKTGCNFLLFFFGWWNRNLKRTNLAEV